MKRLLNFIGRVLISSVFIFASLQAILEWNSREQILYTAISLKMHSYQGSDFIKFFLEMMISHFPLFFALLVFVQIYGGVSLLFSWKVRFGALLLLLYLLPATFFMHDFWNKTSVGKEVDMLLFGKNLAIAGGLFIVIGSPVTNKNEKKNDKGSDRSK